MASWPLSRAFAQEPPSAAGEPDPPGYRAAVDGAITEYAAGNFEEARSLFMQADERFSNARTLRGLGMTSFELRNYVDAIQYLEAALSSTVRPLDAERRADVQQLLARARGFVAHLTLTLSPQDAHVKVDGTTLEHVQPSALLLRVGDHTVDVEAPLYLSERVHVSLNGGEQKQLTIALRKAFVAEAATIPEAPPDDQPAWYRKHWVWGVAGAVLVGAAVGLGVGLSHRGSGDAEPPYGGSTNTLLGGP